MFSLVILAFAVTACSANHFQRIVGGAAADITEHPWQLSLQSASGSHTCGAVLIKSNIALTAAHCVNAENPGNYRIVAGVTKLNDGSAEIVGISRIIRHEQYGIGSGAFPNDIAILFLARELPFSSKINTVEISSTMNYTGSSCYITGWGRLYGSGPIPNTLQEASTTALTHASCERHFGSNVVPEKHVCVFTGENGSCNGDSGGPLVCNDKGKRQLIGLTSFGYAGCPTSSPSVYTRVSTYQGWIDGKIGEVRNM